MTQQPETMTIPCVGTNNVDLLRIPIHFKAANTLTLVDTGSVASLLAERVFRKISEVCTKEETTFSSFVSAGGHPIEICGCFRTPIKLPGYQTTHQFYVIKTLQEDCILGWNFLSQHTTSFSGSRKLLTIGKRSSGSDCLQRVHSQPTLDTLRSTLQRRTNTHRSNYKNMQTLRLTSSLC